MRLKPQALSRKEIIAGYSVKLILGCLYGFIYLHFYDGDDTWGLYQSSLQETSLLRSHPLQFFRNEFTPLHSIEIGHSFAHIVMLYQNDLQYALLVKTMSILHLATGGNYYITVAVFNAIVFFGHYRLFKMLNEQFPGRRKLFFACVFLFLPAVFWVSGYRVEGMLLFFLSLYLLHLFSKKEYTAKRIIFLLVGFIGVFIARPEVAPFLLVASVAFWASSISKRPYLSFATVYLFAGVLFFASAGFLPSGGLPGVMAKKQAEFMALKGTAFDLTPLDPSFSGFMRVMPEAFANTFLRPFPWEASGALQLMASAEIIVFWLAVFICIFNLSSDWKLRLKDPVILFLLVFGCSMYISIGCIVPFPGAIIRYKAVSGLLMICCFAALVRNVERK